MKHVFDKTNGDILEMNTAQIYVCLYFLQVQIIEITIKMYIFIQIISAQSQTYLLIHYFCCCCCCYFSIYKIIYIAMTQNLLLPISDGTYTIISHL